MFGFSNETVQLARETRQHIMFAVGDRGDHSGRQYTLLLGPYAPDEIQVEGENDDEFRLTLRDGTYDGEDFAGWFFVEGDERWGAGLAIRPGTASEVSVALTSH